MSARLLCHAGIATGHDARRPVFIPQRTGAEQAFPSPRRPRAPAQLAESLMPTAAALPITHPTARSERRHDHARRPARVARRSWRPTGTTSRPTRPTARWCWSSGSPPTSSAATPAWATSRRRWSGPPDRRARTSAANCWTPSSTSRRTWRNWTTSAWSWWTGRAGSSTSPPRSTAAACCCAGKPGQERIRYWHEVEDGFAGRQPIETLPASLPAAPLATPR